MTLSRTLLTAAALAAAAIAPSAAHAAEGFTAVTSDGAVAHFHSDSHPGLSKPVDIRGLASGERVVGLDRAPSGELLALTSAGRIADLDTKTGKATPKFAGPVTGAVDPKAALTFAVAPNGASARIITAGRDITVNLANGAATNNAPLGFAAGDANAGTQMTPALDYAADGRLIGVADAQNAFAAQTAPGAATLKTLAKTPFPALEPLRATVASDGSVWAVANQSAKKKRLPQSRVVRYDPATGVISNQSLPFLEQLVAVADDGKVADDTKAPKATLKGRVLRREIVRDHPWYTGLRAKVSQGGQVLASVRLHGKVITMGLGTIDQAGTVKVEFGANKRNDAALRRAIRNHGRVLVHLTVHDFAGNKRIYERSMGLSG
ncbi:MAG TPA: DUF4394 domain-containing protein [Solirubrobacteraceae bacterium]